MSNDEIKEDGTIDLDIFKRQLLVSQDRILQEQRQFGINDTKNNNNNKLLIDEQELKLKITNSDFFEYVVKAVKKTVKCEDVLIRQILYTGLSSYIKDDPLNLGILAPTSEGKTHPVEECIRFFPKEDVYKVGSMSAKVLVREKGILVDGNLNPIEDKIKELKKKAKRLSKKNQEDEREQINEEIEKLYENAKTLIDLRGKILVFLEPPQREVWDILKPILSHDSPEIEFPFVNQTDREGHQTKKVVVKGWPSCIFCSARDESKWDVWPEIKSRCLITSPNMIPQKYQESTKLISLTYGLPNIIQQQKIISNEEIKQARQCILLLKQKIQELRLENNDGNKISVWIPYAELLEKELPSNKGTDVRFQKRVFSLLRIVSIVKFNLKKSLVFRNQTSIIADLDDLKEVLSITQNFDGIPKFKVDFFYEIFNPCFKEKRKIDSNADGKKTEEIIAVTTRELCDYFRAIRKKPISTDNLKHTYLNPLINDGIIDYTESKINARQNIYYPLVTESLSIKSIMNPFDNDSQNSLTIYEKITKIIDETWIFCEIMKLIRCRLDSTDFELTDYLKNKEEFKLLDSPQCGENPLTIGEFTQKYNTEKVQSLIDNKQSNILLDFAKRSPFLSILAKIDSLDNKDITSTTKNKDDGEISNTGLQESLKLSSSLQYSKQLSSIPCYHCSYQGKTENEVLVHSVNAHPGLPARPESSLLELMQKKEE